MKKNLFMRTEAFLLAAMTVFAVGCSDSSKEHQNEPAAESAVSTEAVTSAAALPSASPATSAAAVTTVMSVSTALTTTTVTTTTAATLPPLAPQAEPTVFLDAEIPGTYLLLAPGAGQTVAVQSTLNGKSICSIYDLAEQRFTREVTMKNKTDEVIGVFDDGTIFAINYQNENKALLYPEACAEPTVVKLEMEYIPQLYIDSKNCCVYFVGDDCRKLMKLDRNGQISTQCEDEYIMFIQDINVDQMTFGAVSYSEDLVGGSAYTLYSIETGEALCSVPNDEISFFIAGDQVVNQNKMFSYDKEPAELKVYDRNGTYQKTYSIPKKNKENLQFYGNTSCMQVPYTVTVSEKIQKLSFLDLKTGKEADSGLDLKSNKISYLSQCYVKDAGRWIFVAECVSGKNYKNRMIMSNPAQMQYTADLQSEFKPSSKSKTVQVGEGYRAVRNRADEIEKEFGIRILVGNEVENAECGSGYNLISEEGIMEPELEIGYLNDLREQLAEYPKDFFSHFKCNNGKFGLRISVVARLDNFDDSSFTAAGVSYQSGGWYDIAVCSSYLGSWNNTLHHEMWHAVEELSEKYHAIDANEWEKLNPKKFNYTSDFNSYAVSGTSDTYIMTGFWEKNKNYDKAYFVEQYSKVTPMEDRATLIEEVFNYAGEMVEEVAPQDAVAEISKYPHLKAKLDYLSEISKGIFGYVYWEVMLNAAA